MAIDLTDRAYSRSRDVIIEEKGLRLTMWIETLQLQIHAIHVIGLGGRSPTTPTSFSSSRCKCMLIPGGCPADLTSTH